MTLESICKNAGQLGAILDRTGQPIRQATTEASHVICNEAMQILSCASEQIRKNPVPIVAGAFAFGIAAGCLIVSGRHQATFQERYVDEPLGHATDALSSAFGRLFGNLKFW